MAEKIGEAFVAVRADTTQFASGMKGAVTGIAASFAAIKVGQFLGGAIKEATKAQKVGAQTAAVLKSTGQAANVTAEEIDNLANSLSKKAGVDDEVIASGENMLLTFTKVRNEAGKGNDIFTQATKIALDMSTALGTDLKGANIQLGKALNDPIKGITALTRVGVTFTEQQKSQIKTLVESGNILGAQKVILRELTKEFGGSAEAQATAGEKAAVAIGNLKESIGVALMPVVKLAADAITALADGFNSLPGPMKTIITVATLVGGGILAVGVAADKMGGGFKLMSQGASVAKDALGGLISMLRAGVLTPGPILAVTAAVVALGAAIYLIAGTDGPFERAQSAAEKWAKGTVQAAKSTTNEFSALNSTSKALKAHIADLKDEQARLRAEDSASSGTVEDYNDKLYAVGEQLLKAEARAKALAPALARIREEQAAAKAVHQAASQGMDAYSEALRGGATATTALAAAGKAGQEAITAFQNTLTAAAGGALAYQAAQANLTKAQEDYNLALYLHGAGSKEATAAQLALNQAQLGAVTAAQNADTAQQALIDSLASGNTTYDKQIGLLYDQLRLHPENAAGIQLEVDKLNAAKAAADAIPGSKTVKVTADTSQAQTAFDRLLATTKDIRDFAALGFSGPPGRAAGGPVTGGRTYLVGERGPELFTPAGSGAIIPNNRLGRGGLVIESAYFGDRNVIADLDYWTMTRLSGV